MRRAAVAVVATALALATAGVRPAPAQERPSWLTSEPAAEPEYPRVTVTAPWLAEWLGARDLVVIDARDEAAYSEGHIPGAVSLPPAAVPDIQTLTGAARLPGLLGGLGMTGREQLVCCGETSLSTDAARVWKMLEDQNFIYEHIDRNYRATVSEVKDLGNLMAEMWLRRDD